jgi:hypothetical protein
MLLWGLGPLEPTEAEVDEIFEDETKADLAVES